MDISKYIIPEELSILDTMKIINERAGANVFVCKNGILLAIVSDGDIRRYIIKDGKLDRPISDIANYHPIYVNQKDDIDYIKLMSHYSITTLPVVDDEMRLLDIKFANKKESIPRELIDVPVVIMAGGKGTRLQPYTQILPKPLIPIGEQTITEHIMEHFEKYGCKHFDLIVNYKKNFIKSYFRDSEVKRDISFVEETDFLGTAGGLKLIQGKYAGTFFVTNCDILIDADYAEILKYHQSQENVITVVCAKKKTVIPYGTVKTNIDNKIVSFCEKPEYEFLTSTGLYLVEPEFLELIPENTFTHITDVIQKCIEQDRKVGAFTIDEEAWMDMGQLEELERMKEKMEKQGK